MVLVTHDIEEAVFLADRIVAQKDCIRSGDKWNVFFVALDVASSLLQDQSKLTNCAMATMLRTNALRMPHE